MTALKTTPPPAPFAERRQITVMFCDMVDSTALACRLDPEDLREVVGAYHRFVAENVARFDGFVARYVGDGVLIYFGYPQAHGDDAERAVRTGLALVGGIDTLKSRPGSKLQIRVGIATGLVIVGDLVAGGESQERVVIGEMPNLAARLQSIAVANTVVIAPSTRRLLGDLFEYRELGAIEIKGFADPVKVSEVLRSSLIESRFEAFHAGGTTPLIGRDEELEVLLRRWARARTGEGQAVLISGEPGIGKSRLLTALQERLKVEPHIPLRYFCSPYHSDSALYPIVSHLEHAARFERRDSPERRLEKLKVLLAQAGSTSRADLAFLAELLSLPIGDQGVASNLSPRRKKEKTFEALLNQLEGLSRQSPILMIFEDAHWIDHSTIELLDYTIDRMLHLPLLLLVTSRPEFQSSFAGSANVTVLVLNRLDSRNATRLMDSMMGGKRLPPQITDQIIAHADGVPLFIEELTKAVLESGPLRTEADRFALTGPLPSLAIPNTLQNSLMARLDRLASVREIAQIGAAIGREFGYELIAAVSPPRTGSLDEALDQLVASGLVFRRGSPPDAVYCFKHALVQNAAYSTLLKSTRQRLHARIADELAGRDPRTAEKTPELLAHHLTEAGLLEPAVHQWRQAGRLAIAKSATKEAAAHFRRALDLLGSLPPSEANQQEEIGLQTDLGSALIEVAGLASREVEHAYLRARDLCEQLGERPRQFTIEWGLWRVYSGRADYGSARRLASRLLDRAGDTSPTEFQLQAHHAAWTTLNFTGDAEASRRHIDSGLALYNADEHSPHAFLYGGHDAGVCARNNASQVLLRLGFPEKAQRFSEDAIALAERLGHPQVIAHALNWAVPFCHLRRDLIRAESQSAATLRIVEEHGFANYCAEMRLMSGWLMAERGEPEKAASLMRQELADRVAIGTMYWHAYFLGLLADVCWRAGQADEAARLYREALDWAEAHGEYWFISELHRLRGVLFLQIRRNLSEAENHFRNAIGLARSQSARMWELRAATDLARLWRDQGKLRAARNLLAPVYDWFTEGFDTPDLQEASRLLGELGRN